MPGLPVGCFAVLEKPDVISRELERTNCFTYKVWEWLRSCTAIHTSNALYSLKSCSLNMYCCSFQAQCWWAALPGGWIKPNWTVVCVPIMCQRRGGHRYLGERHMGQSSYGLLLWWETCMVKPTMGAEPTTREYPSVFCNTFLWREHQQSPSYAADDEGANTDKVTVLQDTEGLPVPCCKRCEYGVCPGL